MALLKKIKKIAYIGVFCSSVAAGTIFGYALGHDPSFSVERENGKPALLYYRHTQDGIEQKRYPILELNNDFYLGDANHNLEGALALARLEGRNDMAPYIENLKNEKEELEDKVFKRNITDAIEKIGDQAKLTFEYLKFKYNEFKRSLD